MIGYFKCHEVFGFGEVAVGECLLKYGSHVAVVDGFDAGVVVVFTAIEPEDVMVLPYPVYFDRCAAFVALTEVNGFYIERVGVCLGARNV